MTTKAEHSEATWRAYIDSGLDIEAVASQFTEDAVFEDPPEAPDARIWSGPDALRRFVENFAATWDEYEIEFREVTERGEVAISRLGVRGYPRGLSVPVEAELVFVSHYRGDRIQRQRCFLSLDSALAALDQDAATSRS